MIKGEQMTSQRVDTNHPGDGNSKIKAFIVDDSPMMCRVMEKILGKDPDIRVLGHALSGKEALAFLSSNPCDLCTLDVHMPGMNGLTVLKHIMIRHPIPTLMVSAFTSDGSRVTFEALRYGAVDFFQKPSHQGGEDLEAQADLLRIKAKRAAKVHLEAARYLRLRPSEKISRETQKNKKEYARSITIVYASVGGYAAILSLIPMLSPDLKTPLVVSMGILPKYLDSFTEYLKGYAPVETVRAKDTQELRPGFIYLKSEDEAAHLEKQGERLYMHLTPRADLSTEEGAIDLLLLSASEVLGQNALTVFLSGDGSKGLTGAREIIRNQGRVLAQTPETCLSPELPGLIMKSLDVKAYSPLELAEHISQWRGTDG